jgi:DNA-binding NtrC family response regulator
MEHSKTILLIDDDRDIHIICKKYVEGAGYNFQSALTGAEGLEKLLTHSIDLILLDYMLPDLNGLEVFKELKFNKKFEQVNQIPVIMLTVIAEDASQQQTLLNMGVQLYLKKPYGFPELMNIIENIFIHNTLQIRTGLNTLQQQQLLEQIKSENEYLKLQLQKTNGLENIITSNPAMLNILDKIDKIARTDTNVFISGESGTGKELIARVIHQKSRRQQAAFIAIDCEALPPAVLETELLGIEENNHLGNQIAKVGYLQLAHKGTLFFDEICKMNPDLQSKLLRIIQEKKFRPVGSSKLLDVNLRIISAATCDPATAVQENQLREDLYYRLHVIPIKLPPLRERKEDLPFLVQHFIHNFCHVNGRPRLKFTPESMQILKNYQWPGNVRELQNVVERVISLANTEVIHPEDLPEHILNHSEFQAFLPAPEMSLKEARKNWMEKFERNYLIELLTRCNGNISEVARLAQSNRMTVYRMIKTYRIATNKFMKK